MNLDFNLAPETHAFNFEEEPSLLQVSAKAFEAARIRGASISETTTVACAWDFAHMEEYSQVIEQHATACQEANKDFNAQLAVDELLSVVEQGEAPCPETRTNKIPVAAEQKAKSTVYSKRKDVVYKTLLRKVRKYAQKLFNGTTKYLTTKRFKPETYYREKLALFLSAELKLETSEENVETMATFLYPQDACKHLGTFREEAEIEADCAKTKELLYRYSHEKFSWLMEKRAMRALFAHFELNGRGSYESDKDLARALQVV